MNFISRKKVHILLCLLLVHNSWVLSKPTDEDGEENIVNMKIEEDHSQQTQPEDVAAEANDSPSPNEQTQDNTEDVAAAVDENVPEKPAETVHIQRENEERKDDETGGGEEEAWNANKKLQEEVGVQNPEEIMHEGDGHAHENAAAEQDPNIEKAAQQAAEKESAEEKEIQALNPKFAGSVEEKAKTAADFMKDHQFGPNDIEEVMHDGHHVHEEGHENQGKVQSGDVEKVMHGEDGVHDAKGSDKKVHLTVDPEQLMHTGDGGDHDHDPHEERKSGPGADKPENPDDKRNEEKKVKEHVDKDSFGPTYEKVVHGEDHVHGEVPPNYKPKNKVRYQDIIDLGLNEELLRGIDLNKVLEQEQRELEEFQKKAREGEEEVQGEDEDLENSSYWEEHSSNLRKHYLKKLNAKVKEVTQPDLENAEWDEETQGLNDQVHEGENQVEHEMEMWGNTAAKSDRQPYNVRHGSRGMNEEEKRREENQNGEKKEGEEGREEQREEEKRKEEKEEEREEEKEEKNENAEINEQTNVF